MFLGTSLLKNIFNTLHQKNIATLLLKTQDTESSSSGLSPNTRVTQSHRHTEEGHLYPDQVIMEATVVGSR